MKFLVVIVVVVTKKNLFQVSLLITRSIHYNSISQI